ncbi:MAG: hypothetical protein M9962_11275 [Oligoflexia bacterium]|nr:hypothetical protein [Oligoflexia bacterium]
MKQATKYTFSFLGILFVSVIMFLANTNPARAPHGGKKNLGGRTIASLQEEDFDRKLLHFQVCYGIHFDPGDSTLERRRVCKAILLNQLEQTLEAQGVYVSEKVIFRCANTVFDKPSSGGDVAVGVLSPNNEFKTIHEVLNPRLEKASIAASIDGKARNACTFLTNCKWILEQPQVSYRKVAQCLMTKSSDHRRLILDELSAKLFGVSGHVDLLYSYLVKKMEY